MELSVGERRHADAYRPRLDDDAQLRQHLDEEPANFDELRVVHRAAGRVQKDDDVRLVSAFGRSGDRRGAGGGRRGGSGGGRRCSGRGGR